MSKRSDPAAFARAAGARDSVDFADPAPAPDPPLPALADDGDEEQTPFGPVPLRYRHDGWVPDRQQAFIAALAACGCVDEACRAVGMGRSSAYALRQRSDAQAFRLAWDAAMDVAVARLNDAAMSRAINGVPVPIFQGGEQVGERRHFDERLTMFLLRYRDPMRYGRWLDGMEASRHPEGPAVILAWRVGRMLRAAWAAFNAALEGRPAPEPEREWVHHAPSDEEESC